MRRRKKNGTENGKSKTKKKKKKKKKKNEKKKEIHVYKSIRITDQNIDLYQMCGGWPS